MTALLAAATAALAVAVLGTRPVAARRLPAQRAAGGAAGGVPGGVADRVPGGGPGPRRGLPPPVAVGAAALGAYAFLGPYAAVLAAAATARLLAALPSRADAERDRARAAAVPLFADLVAACVAAGATVDAAVAAAARATPGPLADDATAALRAASLGIPPHVAWAPLLAPERPPPVRALARALVRGADSGAAPAAMLRAVADDARDAARTAGEVAARRAGVVAVLPLGLCFLPAFVLLGIVPLVASLLGGVLG